MIQKVFSVRDSKACAFLQPFFSSANGSALRALSDAVMDGKSPLALHPEDYIMYEIGTFDDQTGELVPLAPIKLLVCASDFVEKRVPKADFGRVMSPERAVALSEVDAVENGSKQA